MNWKQPKVGLPILLLLTIATLVLAYKHNIDYQRYVQETTKWYEDKGINPDIIDLWSWRAWGNGGIVTLLGITTAISWVVLPIIWLKEHRNLRHKKSLLVIFLVPMLLLTSVNIAGGVTDSYVDILFAGDEELMSATEEWLINPWLPFLGTYDRPVTDVIEKETFPLIQMCFADKLGINIRFHGWTSWDSVDGTNDAYDMLQEAIEEIGEYQSVWVIDYAYPGGGYWKLNPWMIWNNVVIDILLGFTYQDMNLYGVAPFDWGAGIVQYRNLAQAKFAGQHELSHLWNVTDCGHNWCIMNQDYFGWTGDWKSTCKDHMIEWKDYFTRYSYPPWDINQDGFCDIEDINIFYKAFATDSSWPHGTGWHQYNPACDIDNDGVIWVEDMYLLGRHFGEEYQY